MRRTGRTGRTYRREGPALSRPVARPPHPPFHSARAPPGPTLAAPPEAAMWRLPSRPRFPWTAILPLLGAGCGGGTAPAAPPKLADAARSVAQLSSVSAPTRTRLFQSFSLLAPYFLRVDSAPITPVRSLALPRLRRWSRPRRVPLRAPGSRTVAAAIFPPTVLRKTLVWDPTAKGYVASSDPG